MRKIDKFLGTVWFVFLPILMSIFLIISAIYLFVFLDDEVAIYYLNACCLLAVILLSGWILNTFISFITWIKDKIHSQRLEKFYKEHPEEEQKNAERLAKDFEEIARIIREGEKKDE